MKRETLLMLTLAALALAAALLPGTRTVDDAFITFRYSRNLVEGNGFVYNPGEKILGTTTPLYTVLMASWGAIFGEHYPTFALLTNAVAGALGVMLLYKLGERITDNTYVAVWIALAWAVAPFSVTFAIGGMETTVHNTIMLGAWYAYLRDRQRLLGVLCGLGVLTRPDALIWAGPLLLHQLWQMRRPPLLTWATGLVTIAPWLIFATVYFGSPLPHTISTKAAVYALESTQALEKLIYLYATPFLEPLTLGWFAGIVGALAYPALAMVGLRSATARDGHALPILVYPWLYFLVFVVANPLIFRWYMSPPLPAYFLAIGGGVAALAAFLPQPLPRRVTVGAAVVTIGLSLNGWGLKLDHGPQTPAPLMAFHDLELNYERMARILRSDYGVDEDTVLAAGDIGALGFYSRAHIFDTIGLVTEGTVPYYENQDELDAVRAENFVYVIPPDLILDRNPDFVVVMEIFIREGLRKDPRFLENYTLIEEIPTDYYGTGMLAFRRNDIPEN